MVAACTEPDVLVAHGNFTHLFQLTGKTWFSLYHSESQISSPSHLMPMIRATSKDRIFSCTNLCAHTWLHHTLSRLWRSPQPLLAHTFLYACRCSPLSPGLFPGKWVIDWKATARSCAYYLHLCLSHAPPAIYTRSLANVIKTR